jgi:hypothetical protein
MRSLLHLANFTDIKILEDSRLYLYSSASWTFDNFWIKKPLAYIQRRFQPVERFSYPYSQNFPTRDLADCDCWAAEQVPGTWNPLYFKFQGAYRRPEPVCTSQLSQHFTPSSHSIASPLSLFYAHNTTSNPNFLCLRVSSFMLCVRWAEWLPLLGV